MSMVKACHLHNSRTELLYLSPPVESAAQHESETMDICLIIKYLDSGDGPSQWHEICFRRVLVRRY